MKIKSWHLALLGALFAVRNPIYIFMMDSLTLFFLFAPIGFLFLGDEDKTSGRIGAILSIVLGGWHYFNYGFVELSFQMQIDEVIATIFTILYLSAGFLFFLRENKDNKNDAILK